MKPRVLTAILLFLSSYAPLGFMAAVLDFDWKTRHLSHPLRVEAIVAVSLAAGIIPFSILRRVTGGEVYTVRKLDDRSGELVNYALPYLVMFVGLKLDDVSSLIGFAMFMVLLCALTVKTQALWINPLLALGGFQLYEAEVQKADSPPFSVFILCKGPLVVGQRCRANYLTDHQLYVTASNLDSRSSGTDRPEDFIRPDQED